MFNIKNKFRSVLTTVSGSLSRRAHEVNRRSPTPTKGATEDERSAYRGGYGLLPLRKIKNPVRRLTFRHKILRVRIPDLDIQAKFQLKPFYLKTKTAQPIDLEHYDQKDNLDGKGFVNETVVFLEDAMKLGMKATPIDLEQLLKEETISPKSTYEDLKLPPIAAVEHNIASKTRLCAFGGSTLSKKVFELNEAKPFGYEFQQLNKMSSDMKNPFKKDMVNLRKDLKNWVGRLSPLEEPEDSEMMSKRRSRSKPKDKEQELAPLVSGNATSDKSLKSKMVAEMHGRDDIFPGRKELAPLQQNSIEKIADGAKTKKRSKKHRKTAGEVVKPAHHRDRELPSIHAPRCASPMLLPSNDNVITPKDLYKPKYQRAEPLPSIAPRCPSPKIPGSNGITPRDMYKPRATITPREMYKTGKKGYNHFQ